MNQVFFWQTFLPLCIAAGALSVAVWAGRRRPPITEELYRDFVRRGELQALEERNQIARDETRATIKILRDNMESMVRTNAKSFSELERALGRIEGAMRNKPSYRGAPHE